MPTFFFIQNNKPTPNFSYKSSTKIEKNQLYSIHSEFAQHKKIIGKKIPIFAQEYKTAK